MGYRKADFAIIWKYESVGLFHQRLSDARWLVGTWEPGDSELTNQFLQAIEEMPKKLPQDMNKTGVPIQYKKLEGGKRSMSGLVEYLGPAWVLKEDDEMVICRYSESELVAIMQNTVSYMTTNS